MKRTLSAGVLFSMITAKITLLTDTPGQIALVAVAGL